ncbi:MAG TPA: hypothetical protein VKE74_14755, partial [Gemmataceae bacterium]|nr:hypothetical protein [Gemmataceae bacterium]
CAALEFRLDLVAWLTTNILIVDDVVDMNAVQDTRPVRMFTLTKVNGMTITNRPTGAVYTLSYRTVTEHLGVGGDDLIAAYWCPYENGDCRGVMLGPSAPYMFTATMNGCSFGVGSATAGGQRMVYHVNKEVHGIDVTDQQAVDAGFVTMAKSQKKKLRKRHVPQTNIIDPRTYGGGTVAVNKPVFGNVYVIVNTLTTVGLRLNNTWRFYTHLYRKTGNTTYTHNGFTPCATIV